MAKITGEKLRDYLHGKVGGLTLEEFGSWYGRTGVADQDLEREIEDFWDHSLHTASADRDEIASSFDALVAGIVETAPDAAPPKTVKRLLRLTASVAAILSVPLIAATVLLTAEVFRSRDVRMMEVYTQYGEIRQLTLPDGSEVWMNSGTQLPYPESFGRERRIMVRGEVFMDVTPDSRKPFVVDARNFTVTVCGTRFNLRSYSEEPASEASLIEGSISLQLKNDPAAKEIVMSPGERVSVDHAGGAISVETFNTENYSSWKDRQYSFRHKTLGEITAEMERIFDVRIVIVDRELESELYLVNFRRGIGLDEMLDALNVGKTLKINREGDFVEIFKNRP